MENLENLSQNELKELWQQLQSLTQEQTRDCGDVVLLWHLAKRLGLVSILDEAASFPYGDLIRQLHPTEFYP